MGDDLKKDIKRLLLLDSLISCTCEISKILDEVEEELDELFGCSEKECKCVEDLFKHKICK